MSTQTDQRLPLSRWWAEHVVTGVDHRGVVDLVRSDAGWSSHFAFMTMMSAGIAVLGLLLSSPAVVIGAMLISPLMGPIIGLGFAVATFDSAEIRRTSWPLVGGSLLAVLFCALIVMFSPLQSVTSEVSSRTRPNLFDLLVALFAGLAGTYAMIRGRHGTIVGVAIATALMPPLAVMGFGLATSNWPVLGGSALLFFTNLMTIAVAAAVLARLYGFAPGLSPHQSRLQAILIILVLIALAVPLGLSLHRIAWEALTGREVSDAIAAEFPKEARVGEYQIDFHPSPIEVTATVLTPRYRQSAERDLRSRLAKIVGGPVNLSLDQIRTADGSDAAASSTTTLAQRSASRVAERLAAVAGVPVDDVLVDEAAKQVLVRAAPLPGATLGTYRELENRLGAADPGWKVNLVPPLLPLPEIKSADAGADGDAQSVQTVIWAAHRLGLPVEVSGSGDHTDQLAKVLTASGVQVVQSASARRTDQVSVRWVVGKKPRS